MCSTGTTHLWDLPDEAVQRITDFLDWASLSALGSLHPRLTAICQDSTPFTRIRSDKVDEWLMHFVTPRASRIRVLNLSRCRSGPDRMEALIRRCENLEELVVADTPLYLDRLLPVLVRLRALRELSVTVSRIDEGNLPGPSTEIQGRYSPWEFSSIHKIYIELRARRDERNSTVRFLKACPNVRHLHAIIVGRPRHLYFGLRGESLKKYDSVVISTATSSEWDELDSFRFVFDDLNSLYEYGIAGWSGFRFRGDISHDKRDSEGDALDRAARSRLQRQLELSARRDSAGFPAFDHDGRIEGFRSFSFASTTAKCQDWIRCHRF